MKMGANKDSLHDLRFIILRCNFNSLKLKQISQHTFYVQRLSREFITLFFSEID